MRPANQAPSSFDRHRDSRNLPGIGSKPRTWLTDRANLLAFPVTNAANAAIQALSAQGNSQPIGPILPCYGGAADIVTPNATERGLLNIAAISVSLRGTSVECWTALLVALASAGALENAPVAALAPGHTGAPRPLARLAAAFTLVKTVPITATLGAVDIAAARWPWVHRRC